MLWSQERDAALRKGIAALKSYAAIAGDMSSQFGCDISRNAVLGRTHRLGLAGMNAQHPQRKSRAGYVIALRSPQPDGPRRRHSILDLKENDCRWPIGEPATIEFYFCGGMVAEGKSYCPHHCRLAYRRPGENR